MSDAFCLSFVVGRVMSGGGGGGGGGGGVISLDPKRSLEWSVPEVQNFFRAINNPTHKLFIEQIGTEGITGKMLLSDDMTEVFEASKLPKIQHDRIRREIRQLRAAAGLDPNTTSIEPARKSGSSSDRKTIHADTIGGAGLVVAGNLSQAAQSAAVNGMAKRTEIAKSVPDPGTPIGPSDAGVDIKAEVIGFVPAVVKVSCGTSALITFARDEN